MRSFVEASDPPPRRDEWNGSWVAHRQPGSHHTAQLYCPVRSAPYGRAACDDVWRRGLGDLCRGEGSDVIDAGVECGSQGLGVAAGLGQQQAALECGQ